MEIKNKDLSSKKDGNILNENKNEIKTKSSKSLAKEEEKAKVLNINDENGFSCFGFNNSILHALEKKGYRDPTPIQKEAIPEIILGKDLLGQAQTGTGKTAAFALPIIQKLDRNKENHAKVLVMTPTS